MALTLYNFLTRRKEPFRPLRKEWVGLYTCGPTVYGYAHIGNLRTYVFEDVLRRALEFNGHPVRHVMNITDVGHLTSDADAGEDKVEEAARKQEKSVWEVARFYTRAFLKDIQKLNIHRAHVLAPATKHVKEQIALIQKLFRRGFAYQTPTAVYFPVPKFKGYTKLSRQPLAQQRIGARQEVVIDAEKRHPADFVLWFKLVGKFKNHVMRWSSPWGVGFPGWHIECSAISTCYLGQPFDIHTGGVDHIPTHHTNEIAQSEAAIGKPFVRFFVEGEHLLVDGERMAKSLRNTYTLADLERRGYDPMDFRYFVLGAHYRKQLNFTWRALAAGREGRRGLLNAVERIRRGPYGGTLRDENGALKVVAAAERDFRAAVHDDLNTPKALAVLNELLHYASQLLVKRLLMKRAATLILAAVGEFDRVLGLALLRRRWERIPLEVQRLVQKREELRKAKRWAEADTIREQTQKLGYTVEDTPTGQKLQRR